MFHEQIKKVNMSFDFITFMKFLEALDIEVEAKFLDAQKTSKLPVYSIDGHKVSVFFRNEIRQHNIPAILREKQELPILVVANYLTPKAKEMLREYKFNYLDSYGNAYLKLSPLKVYLENNNASPYVKPSSKIFTQAGGQLIFQFLQDPKLVNETQRYLADNSMISLGSVSKIMQGLSEYGYIVSQDGNDKYQLLEYEELFDRWIPLVNEKILPKYYLGTFSFSVGMKDEWKKKYLRPQIFWSGEPAAALLTNNFFPEKFSMFTTFESNKDIMQTLKLVPNPNGNIKLYKPFWLQTNQMDNVANYLKDINVVPPVLVYAELIYSGEPRNLEIAQKIFNEHIKPKL